jgi:hypothetical protein
MRYEKKEEGGEKKARDQIVSRKRAWRRRSILEDAIGSRHLEKEELDEDGEREASPVTMP